jgi:hypothetical protein
LVTSPSEKRCPPSEERRSKKSPPGRPRRSSRAVSMPTVEERPSSESKEAKNKERKPKRNLRLYPLSRLDWQVVKRTAHRQMVSRSSSRSGFFDPQVNRLKELIMNCRNYSRTLSGGSIGSQMSVRQEF